MKLRRKLPQDGLRLIGGSEKSSETTTFTANVEIFDERMDQTLESLQWLWKNLSKQNWANSASISIESPRPGRTDIDTNHHDATASLTVLHLERGKNEMHNLAIGCVIVASAILGMGLANYRMADPPTNSTEALVAVRAAQPESRVSFKQITIANERNRQ